ncbi:hypothetical protein DIPPA_14641 [Diplonema papillatum]|nr:hypothetical protein DIPPA_14641 [Diplonema papillatum]
MPVPDASAVVSYLKVSDAQDKNIKFVQYTLRTYADLLLDPKDPFVAKQKQLNQPLAATRRILSLLKPFYQYHALSKESSQWNGPLSPKQLLKVVVVACTFFEQGSSDLTFLHEYGFAPSLSRPWLDFTFSFSKGSANVLTLIGELAELQAKQRYCASPKADSEKVKKYRVDIFRHQLAVIRSSADSLIYLAWIDNWKRTLTPRYNNILGLISSIIGVYEVFNPHTHTPVAEL